MTPRRHRTFRDHKPPLVAFVLVMVASTGLMVHVARSDAAPAWLRDRAAVVVSGGAPLTRQVVERTAPDRDPAPAVADAPVLAAPPTPGVRPSTAPSRAPARPPRPAALPTHEGRTTPDVQPAPQAASEEPSPLPAYPGKDPELPAHQAPGLPDVHLQGELDLQVEGDDGRPEPLPPVPGHRSEHGQGPLADDRGDRGDGPRGWGHGWRPSGGQGPHEGVRP